MITPGVVWALGASQLLCWGISYYLIAIFAEPISSETGWSMPVVYGGFSAALIVMGVVSPTIGRMIDRWGGRPVMTIGSCLMAVGCVLLAGARTLPHYYAAWLILGLAMRMTLYDAAFATLARIGGRKAQRPISQITLLGGLASTALWPVGQFLIEALGWRHALWGYAVLALTTVPLYRKIPTGRDVWAPLKDLSPVTPRAASPAEMRLAAVLFASGLMGTTFLASALSAHMISLLSSLGLATTVAVWVSALRGVGQSGARLCEIILGRHLDPLMLGVVASGLTVIGVASGLLAGTSLVAALAFSLLFGAGNGLATIVRGTQPLILFDLESYGFLTGWLITPSFFISAAAPVTVSFLSDTYGAAVVIILALLFALSALISAIALFVRFN